MGPSVRLMSRYGLLALLLAAASAAAAEPQDFDSPELEFMKVLREQLESSADEKIPRCVRPGGDPLYLKKLKRLQDEFAKGYAPDSEDPEDSARETLVGTIDSLERLDQAIAQGQFPRILIELRVLSAPLEWKEEKLKRSYLCHARIVAGMFTRGEGDLLRRAIDPGAAVEEGGRPPLPPWRAPSGASPVKAGLVNFDGSAPGSPPGRELPARQAELKDAFRRTARDFPSFEIKEEPGRPYPGSGALLDSSSKLAPEQIEALFGLLPDYEDLRGEIAALEARQGAGGAAAEDELEGLARRLSELELKAEGSRPMRLALEGLRRRLLAAMGLLDAKETPGTKLTVSELLELRAAQRLGLFPDLLDQRAVGWDNKNGVFMKLGGALERRPLDADELGELFDAYRQRPLRGDDLKTLDAALETIALVLEDSPNGAERVLGRLFDGFAAADWGELHRADPIRFQSVLVKLRSSGERAPAAARSRLKKTDSLGKFLARLEGEDRTALDGTRRWGEAADRGGPLETAALIALRQIAQMSGFPEASRLAQRALLHRVVSARRELGEKIESFDWTSLPDDKLGRAGSQVFFEDGTMEFISGDRSRVTIKSRDGKYEQTVDGAEKFARIISDGEGKLFYEFDPSFGRYEILRYYGHGRLPKDRPLSLAPGLKPELLYLKDPRQPSGQSPDPSLVISKVDGAGKPILDERGTPIVIELLNPDGSRIEYIRSAEGQLLGAMFHGSDDPNDKERFGYYEFQLSTETIGPSLNLSAVPLLVQDDQHIFERFLRELPSFDNAFARAMAGDQDLVVMSVAITQGRKMDIVLGQRGADGTPRPVRRMTAYREFGGYDEDYTPSHLAVMIAQFDESGGGWELPWQVWRFGLDGDKRSVYAVNPKDGRIAEAPERIDSRVDGAWSALTKKPEAPEKWVAWRDYPKLAVGMALDWYSERFWGGVDRLSQAGHYVFSPFQSAFYSAEGWLLQGYASGDALIRGENAWNASIEVEAGYTLRQAAFRQWLDRWLGKSLVPPKPPGEGQEEAARFKTEQAAFERGVREAYQEALLGLGRDQGEAIRKAMQLRIKKKREGTVFKDFPIRFQEEAMEAFESAGMANLSRELMRMGREAYAKDGFAAGAGFYGLAGLMVWGEVAATTQMIGVTKALAAAKWTKLPPAVVLAAKENPKLLQTLALKPSELERLTKGLNTWHTIEKGEAALMLTPAALYAGRDSAHLAWAVGVSGDKDAAAASFDAAFTHAVSLGGFALHYGRTASTALAQRFRGPPQSHPSPAEVIAETAAGKTGSTGKPGAHQEAPGKAHDDPSLTPEQKIEALRADAEGAVRRILENGKLSPEQKIEALLANVDAAALVGRNQTVTDAFLKAAKAAKAIDVSGLGPVEQVRALGDLIASRRGGGRGPPQEEPSAEAKPSESKTAGGKGERIAFAVRRNMSKLGEVWGMSGRDFYGKFLEIVRLRPLTESTAAKSTKTTKLMNLNDVELIHPITPNFGPAYRKAQTRGADLAKFLNKHPEIDVLDLNFQQEGPVTSFRSKEAMRAIQMRDGKVVVYDGNGRLFAIKKANGELNSPRDLKVELIVVSEKAIGDATKLVNAIRENNGASGFDPVAETFAPGSKPGASRADGGGSDHMPLPYFSDGADASTVLALMGARPSDLTRELRNLVSSEGGELKYGHQLARRARGSESNEEALDGLLQFYLDCRRNGRIDKGFVPALYVEDAAVAPRAPPSDLSQGELPELRGFKFMFPDVPHRDNVLRGRMNGRDVVLKLNAEPGEFAAQRRAFEAAALGPDSVVRVPEPLGRQPTADALRPEEAARIRETLGANEHLEHYSEKDAVVSEAVPGDFVSLKDVLRGKAALEAPISAADFKALRRAFEGFNAAGIEHGDLSNPSNILVGREPTNGRRRFFVIDWDGKPKSRDAAALGALEAELRGKRLLSVTKDPLAMFELGEGSKPIDARIARHRLRNGDLHWEKFEKAGWDARLAQAWADEYRAKKLAATAELFDELSLALTKRKPKYVPGTRSPTPEEQTNLGEKFYFPDGKSTEEILKDGDDLVGYVPTRYVSEARARAAAEGMLAAAKELEQIADKLDIPFDRSRPSMILTGLDKIKHRKEMSAFWGMSELLGPQRVATDIREGRFTRAMAERMGFTKDRLDLIKAYYLFYRHQSFENPTPEAGGRAYAQRIAGRIVILRRGDDDMGGNYTAPGRRDAFAALYWLLTDREIDEGPPR